MNMKSNYHKTKKRVIAQRYYSQLGRSIKRGHAMPTYTQEELIEWAMSQKKFHVIYDNWKRLDFQKNYAPSFDRKDDYIGYTLDNIEVTTWKKNRTRGHKDRKNGINNKHSKKVYQYTKDGKFVKEYHSQIEAERQTGISNANISKACNEKQYKTAGGFKWTRTKKEK